MYNVAQKNEIVNSFTSVADANLKVARMFGSISDCMKKDDASMAKFLIKKAVDSVIAAVPEELSVSDVAVYINQNGDDAMIRTIDVVLRNKYSSDYEFKFKGQLVYSENYDVYDVLADFLKCSYIELITDALINKNLEEVNAKFAEIGKEAGNTFSVKVVSPLAGEGKKIAKITDKEVVFVADETRILEMDDILIFCEPNEVLSEEVIKQGYDNTVALFAQAQTTVQFVGVHEPVVGYICDISKLVKATTLIKKVYSKNAKKLGNSKKDALAYYNENGVFAVVSATEDGKEVVLQPFNTETLEVVDYDVLANI